jgi:hypothetical protein
MADDRDSARKGKAIELLVAATCILASNLKLNVSVNLVDDEGVDLIFHRRDDPTTLAVQVKGRLLTAKTIEKKEAFRTNIKSATFHPRPGLAMLFVAVDARKGTMPFIWLIPSEEFRAKFAKANTRGRFIFVASTKANTKDRWSQYRCSQAELPDGILAELDTLGR